MTTTTGAAQAREDAKANVMWPLPVAVSSRRNLKIALTGVCARAFLTITLRRGALMLERFLPAECKVFMTSDRGARAMP